MVHPHTFWRSPRLKLALPEKTLEIPEPPMAPTENSSPLLWTLLPPLLGVTIMIIVSSVMGRGTLIWFSAPMMLASVIGAVIVYRLRQRAHQQQIQAREQGYYALLKHFEQEVNNLRQEQHHLLTQNDPDLVTCYEHVANRNRTLWARTPTDTDFLVLRVGLGELTSTVQLKAPTVRDVLQPDPIILAAQELVNRYAKVHNAPICISVREAGTIGIAGERAAILHSLFALLLQLATHHSPTEVKLVGIFPPQETKLWAWLRWLPHVWRDDRRFRYLACEEQEIVTLLGRLNDILNSRKRQLDPHQQAAALPLPVLLCVLACEELVRTNPLVQRILTEGPTFGIYPIVLGENTKSLPPGCGAIIRTKPRQHDLILQANATFGLPYTPDTYPLPLLDQFALAIAPLQYYQQVHQDIPSTVSFMDLLNMQDAHKLVIPTLWENSRKADKKSLRVPIGIASGNEVLFLDLHEKADGPNGLIAGTVGSGKSELLQTLVLSLAIHHHPHRLAFVLIDYKGGGMTKPFSQLPHVLGIITNLQDETLAIRALTSLRVELERRQAHFDQANVDHIDDYQRLWANGQVKAAMPYLCVIVDEFAEMKTEQPEIAKEFIRLARTGRSLGLRLILAMQKPEGIVDGQIEANTRFRICLRVAQPEDSKAMLKRPDAAYLSGVGRALLQVGADEVFSEFQVAWSGAPYDPTHSRSDHPLQIEAIPLNGERQVLYRPQTERGAEQDQLAVLIKQIEQIAKEKAITALPRLWHPPLAQELTLSTLHGNRPWDSQQWQVTPPWLTVTIGMMDEPAKQAQYPLTINLATQGHLVVYGSPGFGKSTFVQTIVIALALAYKPSDVQIYLLDFGGRWLTQLEPLPHVGGVITADDTERLERLFYLLRQQLEERRQLLGQGAYSSFSAWRSANSAQLPALIVMIDNFSNFIDTLTQERDDETQKLFTRLLQDGANYGLHFVITAHSPSQLRPAISNQIQQAIALNLVDRSDYPIVVGRLSGLAVPSKPGRGILRGAPPLECQIALSVNGNTEIERYEQTKALISRIRDAWPDDKPLPLRTMPDFIKLSELPWPTDNTLASIPLGVSVEDFTPLYTNIIGTSGLVIAGPTQSGKSALLYTWICAMMQSTLRDHSTIYIFDSQHKALAALQQKDWPSCYYAVDAKAGDLLIQQLEEQIPNSDDAHKTIIVIDDFYSTYHEILTDQHKQRLTQLIRQNRRSTLFTLIAGSSADLSSKRGADPLRTLLEVNNGILLGAIEANNPFNLRPPIQTKKRIGQPGEGYFLQRGQQKQVKFAIAEELIKK